MWVLAASGGLDGFGGVGRGFGLDLVVSIVQVWVCHFVLANG